MLSPQLDSLGDVRVRARVILPATALPLSSFRDLRPGTLLRLPLTGLGTAELYVNGVALAEGEVVNVGGTRALRITEVL